MSVNWFGITLTVEISFTTAPLGTSVWTDVSAYLREVPEIFHGKTDEDAEIGPAKMTLLLANRDRRFDPDHAGSPYSPNLKPMKAIRYRMAFGAFSKTLFTGYVQGWPQRWDRRFDGATEITAIGATRLLNNSTLPASAYEVEVLADAPDGYWPLQGLDLTARVGADMMTSDTFGGSLNLSAADLGLPLGQQFGIHLGEFDRLIGPMALTGPKAIEVWVNVDAGGETGDVSLLAYVSSTTWMRLSIGGSGSLSMSYSHAGDNERVSWPQSAGQVGTGTHHVALVTDGTSLYCVVDGTTTATVALTAGTQAVPWTSPTVGMNVSVELPIGVDGDTGGLSHVAVYETAPSLARFDAHHQVGRWAWAGSHGDFGWERGGARINRILDNLVEGAWPASLRDIDDGGTLHGPWLPGGQNALEAIRDVVRAECGVLCINTAGQISFIDRQALWTTADTGTIISDDEAPGSVVFKDFRPEGNTVETIRNIVTTSFSDVGAITRRDQTSIDAYGASAQSDACPTLPSASVASLRSAFVLREKKDPKTRITELNAELRGPVGTSAITTQITKLLALEIGTILTTEHTPMGVGAQTVKKVMVLGIKHQITRTQWVMTFYLSPPWTSAADSPYLTLGHATNGKVGAAFGNLIPY